MITAEIRPDEGNDRIFTCVMTKEVVDRDGEVVLIDGIDFKSFLQNPVVMFDHGKDKKVGKIPVGKATMMTREGDTVMGKVELAERPATHPYDAEWVPDTLASLVKQRCLNCVSIGFIETKTRKAGVNDRKKYGPNAKKIVEKCDVFELSMTGVPVNAEALVTARGKSLVPKKSYAYIEPESPAEREKIKIPVKIKAIKRKVEVEISQTERIKSMVEVRVKGGLYA